MLRVICLLKGSVNTGRHGLWEARQRPVDSRPLNRVEVCEKGGEGEGDICILLIVVWMLTRSCSCQRTGMKQLYDETCTVFCCFDEAVRLVNSFCFWQALTMPVAPASSSLCLVSHRGLL